MKHLHYFFSNTITNYKVTIIKMVYYAIIIIIINYYTITSPSIYNLLISSVVKRG